MQFHSEVTHTENGKQYLKIFYFSFVRSKKIGVLNHKKKIIEKIKEKLKMIELYALFQEE